MIGILVVGWTLTRVLIPVAGVAPLQEQLQQFIQGDSNDFLGLAGTGFLTLLMQFCCLMIPAWLVSRFVGKRGLKDFGIGNSRVTFFENIQLGVILFCLAGIPMKVLLLSNQFFDLGMVPAYWALFDKDWNLSFWVFMAVGSYLVIPVFEEIFYRGYAFGRMHRELGFFAVILVAVLFASVHFQYYVADIFNTWMLLSLLVLAIAMGFARHLTGSIAAPVTIHALMNIPFSYPYDIPMLLAMLVILLLARKKLAGLLAEFARELRSIDKKDHALLLVIVFFAAGMLHYPEVTVVGFATLLVVSLTVQIRNRLRGQRSGKIQ